MALWLDDPEAFRSRWGGSRPKVEEARARVEEHVFQRSRAVMHRRFDRLEEAAQPCAAPAVVLPVAGQKAQGQEPLR